MNKPDFKNIYKDAIAFLTPLVLWLLLVDKFSLEDSFFTYLYSLFDVVLGHQSSGIESPSFVGSFSSSEVQNWNNYDLARVLFAPVVAIYFIISTREKFNLSFGNLALHFWINFIYLFMVLDFKPYKVDEIFSTFYYRCIVSNFLFDWL